MPFSHHSHSGQFCPGHAKNTLEEMIQRAISLNMQTFAVTEHMPRPEEDFYPEEIRAGFTIDILQEYHDAFYEEAVRLRDKYKSRIDILIGLETDWIRGSSITDIEKLLSRHGFHFYVSSVHHVHTIPIDYDTSFYVQARDVAGGKDERLFEDYFDAQFTMLEALKPPVIGHFDLIRLKSDDPERSFQQWPQVWCKILRNLNYLARYGGLLELNFASLRKGMSEPYPKREICKVSRPRHGAGLGRVVPNGWQAFLEKGGRFCLSDDSHGVDQVALNYHSALDFLDQVGIEKLHYLEHSDEPSKGSIFPRFPNTDIKSIDLTDLKQHRFWS